MNATFKIDGCYELEIVGDGTMTSKNGLSSCSSGNIGFQLHHTPLSLGDDAANGVTTVAAFYLSRSRARAIASAMLSAASEAGNAR